MNEVVRHATGSKPIRRFVLFFAARKPLINMAEMRGYIPYSEVRKFQKALEQTLRPLSKNHQLQIIKKIARQLFVLKDMDVLMAVPDERNELPLSVERASFFYVDAVEKSRMNLEARVSWLKTLMGKLQLSTAAEIGY
jgi:hypothetical protein